MAMVPPCVNWLPVLWRRLMGSFARGTKIDLPCEVIVDIFSRIPAALIVECCHRCNLFRALMSPQSFIDTHLERATSHFVYAESDNLIHGCKIPVNIIDSNGQILFRKYIEVDPSNMSCVGLRLVSSHRGLLLFEGNYNVILWNPVTQGKAIVEKHPYYRSCGFCMDPKTREWKVIFVCVYNSCRIIIYNLRTKTERESRIISHRPCLWKPPVILDGSLYWLVDNDHFSSTSGRSLEGSESILVLDIVSENIRTMAQPVGDLQRDVCLHLLDMSGSLGFCDSSHSTYPNLNIWLLQDEIWSRKYTVNLQLPCTPFKVWVIGVNMFPNMLIEKDDLFLTWVGEIYSYNLISRRWSKLKLQQPTYGRIFVIYNASLVALDTDSNIYTPKSAVERVRKCSVLDLI